MTLILTWGEMGLVPSQILREKGYLIRFLVIAMGRRKGKQDWENPSVEKGLH